MMGWIDRISEGVGKAVSWLIPLLILELVYDTVSRYLFNAPSEWSYDISYMLYGTLFMFGAAHTLAVDKHVRIEILSDKVTPRTRAMIDAVCYVIFFFPAVGALLYFGILFALKSWNLLEVSGESMWGPPIYPFKTVIPIAAALLLLQGVAQFVRCMTLIVKGNHDDLKP
ncbi:MAG: TRAP transporter small permease subunit [Deltaproteobacteria bacterium]|nr:TRAP transporter small permease subunit [Deltaproteobacteria bacterium]